MSAKEENPLTVLQDKKPWYKDGLRFQCTECGKCCTGFPGYVWVNEEEIAGIAQFLELDVEEFCQKYLRLVSGKWALREVRASYDCIFLKDTKCTVYPVRPKQCKTYPWWPDNLVSEAAWEEAAKYCEGICSEAPKVSYEEIQRQMQEGT